METKETYYRDKRALLTPFYAILCWGFCESEQWCRHTHTHIHTYIHTYIHIHTHTHIYTHMHTDSKCVYIAQYSLCATEKETYLALECGLLL